MSQELLVLVGTAFVLGFVHTILGPDHYLPFIMISKARSWSIGKTGRITFLCGLGHILSSVFLGFIGIVLGVAVFKLEAIESVRGDVAGWLLIIFGFTYFVWGLHMAIHNRVHAHSHTHDNEEHSGAHSHLKEHFHIPGLKNKYNLTPWVLFIIFVFGPCEPLIPILMYPAAKGNMLSVMIVASVFGVTTIVTMMSLVLVSSFGLSRLPLRGIERYSHALAGFVVFLCGGAIKFLGL